MNIDLVLKYSRRMILVRSSSAASRLGSDGLLLDSIRAKLRVSIQYNNLYWFLLVSDQYNLYWFLLVSDQ